MIKNILAGFIVMASFVALAQDKSSHKDEDSSSVGKLNDKINIIDESIHLEAEVNNKHKRLDVKDHETDSKKSDYGTGQYKDNAPPWDTAGGYLHGRLKDIKNSVKKHQELGTVNKWSPVKNAN